MQGDTGQAAPSSANHTATDLRSLYRKRADPTGFRCLFDEGGLKKKKEGGQSSGTETNIYIAKHKSILAFPPPSYS